MISSRKIAEVIFKLTESGFDFEKVYLAYEKLSAEMYIKIDRDNIFKHVKRMADKKEDNLTVHISSSHDLSTESVSSIKQMVGAGENSVTRVSVDENLIGGFRAEYKSRVYDATVRHQLVNLKRHIMN